MHYFFVDESGSITSEHCKDFPYFVIALVKVFDKDKLKRKFKRFISANLTQLRNIDSKGKMFDKNGKFLELKGCCLTRELKNKFIDYLTKEQLFEVYYIKLVNKKISPSL